MGMQSTFMVHHVAEALDRDPGARFIWLVRDPRDVAVSPDAPYSVPFIRSSPPSSGTPSSGGMRVAAEYPDAVLMVAEADHALEPTLKRIMDFLGEELQPEMLAHEQTAAAKKGQTSASLGRTREPR